MSFISCCITHCAAVLLLFVCLVFSFSLAIFTIALVPLVPELSIFPSVCRNLYPYIIHKRNRERKSERGREKQKKIKENLYRINNNISIANSVKKNTHTHKTDAKAHSLVYNDDFSVTNQQKCHNIRESENMIVS